MKTGEGFESYEPRPGTARLRGAKRLDANGNAVSKAPHARNVSFHSLPPRPDCLFDARSRGVRIANEVSKSAPNHTDRV
ncbi:MULTISPECIES: hypothetical protein [unclassified Haladaptatus]|uniref:hypothetical protein n=1 Tax=unclassified Haladaptatus TaxID=2622732 RepID=UPI00209C0AA5|nr:MULTISPECIES: hypothetical protein [unclassified Haladaptatus]MCO8243876.1 hypothetical protein [Haladaptatus sp. AB643]MCO8253490.1 hypothetical protein [Haladaptatus sp. AB618]